MKKWLKQNNSLLKFFGFYTIFTFIFSAYFITLVTENINELQVYAQSRVLTGNLTKVGLTGIFNLLVIGIWIIIFMTILFKAIFPKKNSFKNAFFFEEMNFLKNLPKSIKGEINNE